MGVNIFGEFTFIIAWVIYISTNCGSGVYVCIDSGVGHPLQYLWCVCVCSGILDVVPMSVMPLTTDHHVQSLRCSVIRASIDISSSLQCTIVRRTTYSVRRTIYGVHCTPYSVCCTMYSVHSMLYVSTLYIVQCTLYNVHCTVYIEQCTLNDVRTFSVYVICLYTQTMITYYSVQYSMHTILYYTTCSMY